jgi:hypothetical protein
MGGDVAVTRTASTQPKDDSMKTNTTNKQARQPSTPSSGRTPCDDLGRESRASLSAL